MICGKFSLLEELILTPTLLLDLNGNGIVRPPTPIGRHHIAKKSLSKKPLIVTYRVIKLLTSLSLCCEWFGKVKF